MRKIIDLILLLIFFAFLFWQKEEIIANFNYLRSGPCDRPITYRLGEVDSGYGLSREQFLGKIERANEIWSSVVSKNLFSETSNGQLTINLIYSERQAVRDKLGQRESNLQSDKQSLDSSVADYKKQQLDFEKRLLDFNTEVGKWKEGMTEDIFNRLKKQQDELRAEADRLNKLAQQLNQTVEKYNLGIGQFNQAAQDYNQLVQEKPEAGLFQASVPEIDIYLTTSDKELIHTLAHELGHALNLDHVSDPVSIMYPYTNEIIQPDLQEKTQLQAYCRQKNWEIVAKKIKNNLKEKFNQWKK